ncbi:hypothetical protein [Xanthomonas euvesicatoria]|uniref:hypothetical protein n=1 Tax=Xanthomonas euvesicatoria TaxID=456327 RepID=UPI001E60BE71|nr:hypothetical protein [Xanthomonas euvesicatoria]
MKYDAVMEQFKQAQTRLIKIGELRTHDALQPRVARLVPFKDKGRAEESSEQHIATLRFAWYWKRRRISSLIRFGSPTLVAPSR